MADGEEEMIPMGPVDSLDPDPDGEKRNPHHEEETVFGGRDNHAFDHDDYETDEQREKARSTISWLEENGIAAPTGVKYSEVDGTRLVSLNGDSWYEIAIGATSSGERFALIPFRGAPDPPLTLLLRFGPGGKAFKSMDEELKEFFPEVEPSVK